MTLHACASDAHGHSLPPRGVRHSRARSPTFSAKSPSLTGVPAPEPQAHATTRTPEYQSLTVGGRFPAGRRICGSSSGRPVRRVWPDDWPLYASRARTSSADGLLATYLSRLQRDRQTLQPCCRMVCLPPIEVDTCTQPSCTCTLAIAVLKVPRSTSGEAPPPHAATASPRAIGCDRALVCHVCAIRQ